MRHSRFYTDQDIQVDQSISITDNRAHYMRNVLRLKSGDTLTLFNGKGGEYESKVAAVKKHEVSIDIHSYSPENRSAELEVVLGLSLIKREAMDAAIQKATELGVTKIQPLISQNTSVSLKGMDKRLRHWQEISINACEQCGLNILPIINLPINIDIWFKDEADLKLIAYPPVGEANTEKDGPSKSPESIMLAIGPEGGFIDDEIQTALSENFKSVSLGPRILRADTAVSALMSLTQFQWGDLK